MGKLSSAACVEITLLVTFKTVRMKVNCQEDTNKQHLLLPGVREQSVAPAAGSPTGQQQQ